MEELLLMVVCVGMVADDDGRWEGNVQKRRYASWWMFVCVLFYFAVVLSFFRSFFHYSCFIVQGRLRLCLFFIVLF